MALSQPVKRVMARAIRGFPDFGGPVPYPLYPDYTWADYDRDRGILPAPTVEQQSQCRGVVPTAKDPEDIWGILAEYYESLS